MSKFLVSAPASTPATTDRVQTQLRPRKHPYTAIAYVSTRPLLSPSTSSNVLVVLMAAEAEVVTNGVNGTNGKAARSGSPAPAGGNGKPRVQPEVSASVNLEFHSESQSTDRKGEVSIRY